MSSSCSFADRDIVSFIALHLSASIGPDQWHRIRPQPVQLSLQLHLAPRYLDAPGRSDDVTDSLHYGHLAKAVEKRVGENAEQGYPSARALLEDVTDAAFAFAKDATGTDVACAGQVVNAVRVILSAPKQILLAEGFEVELTTRASEWAPQSGEDKGVVGSKAGSIVRVTGLILPVLVGVNPPERLSEQRVVTDITFFEAARSGTFEGAGVEVDYPTIVRQIAMDVERSSYLTLEKLVYEIILTAYRTSDAKTTLTSPISPINTIAVRCRKPSALSFADASAVEMTRTRRSYLASQLS